MENPTAANFLVGHTLRMRRRGKKARFDFFGSTALRLQSGWKRVEEVES